jgi:Domain of Unknown Function (DUF326)
MTRLLVSLFAFGLVCVALSAANPPPLQPSSATDAQDKADKKGDKDAKNQKDDKDTGHKVPKDTCVKPCLDCSAACFDCMKHSREKKMEDMARHCEVCHHACLLCARAVGYKDHHAWAACELCEKICIECAEACEKSKDDHAQKCAKACRDCAKACAEARGEKPGK